MIKKHRRNTRERRNGEREREKEVVGRSVGACLLSSFSLGFEVGAKSKFTRSVSDLFGSLRFSSVLSPSFIIGGGTFLPPR